MCSPVADNLAAFPGRLAAQPAARGLGAVLLLAHPSSLCLLWNFLVPLASLCALSFLVVLHIALAGLAGLHRMVGTRTPAQRAYCSRNKCVRSRCMAARGQWSPGSHYAWVTGQKLRRGGRSAERRGGGQSRSKADSVMMEKRKSR